MTDRIALDVVVYAVGWALLHSVWQGAAVAALAALALRTLRRRASNARYAVACIALVALVTGWIVTAAQTGRAYYPVAVAAAATLVTPPAHIELGAAGPFDRTPAIRPLATLDVRETRAPRWRERLEAWSVSLVPLWFAGVFVLTLRLVLGWRAVQRLRRTATVDVSASLQTRVAFLSRCLGIRRVVRVAQSAVVPVPAMIGWLRPLVLLPLRALTGLTAAQLDAVIAHELAHIRRHDYAVNVLQSAAEVLLFYHPACWWLSARIRVEREHCCDDLAVSVCGDRVAYATALADLASLRGDPALVLAATDGDLLHRIRRVVAAVPDRPGPSGGAAALLLGVVALLVAIAWTSEVTAVTAGAGQSAVPSAGRNIPADEGVVQGRTVDAESGRPVSQATILVMGSDASATATTGADGRYEVAGLKPGSYRVSARAWGFVEGQYGAAAAAIMDLGGVVDVRGARVTTGIDVRLQRAASLSGRILNAQGEGLAGVEVELLTEREGIDATRPAAVAFAQTDADGAYHMRDVRPGSYYVRGYTSAQIPTTTNGRAIAYAPAFYPSVPSVGEAAPLRLYAGQELLDVDFTLTTTPLLRLSGTVVDPSGEPLDGIAVVLHPMGASGGPGGSPRLAGIDARGRFAMRDVMPGSYMLNVRDSRRTSRWVSAMRVLTIDADTSDVEILASPGARIEGRVVPDPGTTKTFDPTKIRVGFEKRLDGGGFSMAGGPTIGSDGTFSVESPGGAVVVKVEVPAGWMVKSIRLDGADLGDELVDLGSGRRAMEVVLTDKVSAVSGMVVDRNGRTLPSYSMVIFPPDRTRWHPSSRFIRAARSDSAGQFLIEGVPPGEYLAVAVPGLPMNAWTNADVLSGLETGAERIRIAEGQHLTISIRASPTPN